jgi:thioredoxin-like negative regulator of GroEL
VRARLSHTFTQTLTVISFELEFSSACREQGPELSELATGPLVTKRRTRFFSLVCSDRAAAKLAHALSVTRVPAFVIFQDGVPLATLVGDAADGASLKAALERAVSKDAARAARAEESKRNAAAASADRLLAGNKFAEAVVQYTRALDAGTCGNRRRAELSLDRARASFKAAATSEAADEDFRASERDANMVIALAPEHALAMRALELRARVRHATGKLDAAVADCREVIESKVRAGGPAASFIVVLCRAYRHATRVLCGQLGTFRL